MNFAEENSEPDRVKNDFDMIQDSNLKDMSERLQIKAESKKIISSVGNIYSDSSSSDEEMMFHEKDDSNSNFKIKFEEKAKTKNNKYIF